MTALLSRRVRTAQTTMETSLQEINNTPLLSADEERRVAQILKSGTDA